MDSETKRKYGDIIDLPHHRSTFFKHMPIYERAAQFSPFAALVGHSDAIKETARITDDFIELTDEQKASLNNKLLILIENAKSKPEITLTFFVPDKTKTGGKYLKKHGVFYKYCDYQKRIEFASGESVMIKFVANIESDIFSKYENL